MAAIGTATTVLGTIAAYSTVAGAVLTGVGALTGKKDLMKIGGVLSLAGGLGTMASNAANAASAGGSVVDATGGLETAVESTANTGVAAGAAGGAAANASVPIAPPRLEAMQMPGGAEQIAPGAGPISDVANMRIGSVPMAAPTAAPQMNAPAVQSVPGVPDALSQGAQSMSQNDILNYVEKLGTTPNQPSLWDRVGGIGRWAEANPNTAKLVGQFVPGAVAAYGQARQEDMLEKQQQYQQSLMEQARARLNSPVRITYGGR